MKEKKDKKFKFDRIWVLDKTIELSIFVLGFLIALWIDGVRDDNQMNQLKEHYLEIVEYDLIQDQVSYEDAYRHDSIRADGCDYILYWLLKRQRSEFHSYGALIHPSSGMTGPGFDFEEGINFDQGDTIQIIDEKEDWILDTSGFWINQKIVKSVYNEFSWFSEEINDTVVNKIKEYSSYVDDTKSVFQQTKGYEGLISQNTSSFLNTTSIETELSNYYSFGAYLNWLENYYRDNHYGNFNELRYTYGQTDLFRFLYLIDDEQNNELIRQLTLASIHAKKEKRYYLEILAINKSLQELIEGINF